MALEWFGLETWIREDTLVREKRVAERGMTRNLTVLNITHQDLAKIRVGNADCMNSLENVVSVLKNAC